MAFAAIGGRYRSSLLGAAACALVALLSAGGARGGDENHAYVSPALREAATTAPAARFRVIVQGERGQTSHAVGSAVDDVVSGRPGGARGVGRRFASISGVAAELT